MHCVGALRLNTINRFDGRAGLEASAGGSRNRELSPPPVKLSGTHRTVKRRCLFSFAKTLPVKALDGGQVTVREVCVGGVL